MRYIARRIIDLFRIGDEVPPKHYPPDTLKRLVEKGLIEVVDDAPAVVVAPAPPPTTTRKAKRKA